MDITFALCPNLLGALGLCILLVFTQFNFYLDKKRLNMFRAAAVLNLAIIVFELVDYLLGGAQFPTAYLLRRVTSATGFALSPVFPLLLVGISCKSKLPRWLYIPAAANLVMSYASIFTGHMFLIDQWNSYYRGPLFVVMLAISIFYMLALIYVSLKNLQRVRANESIFLICIAAIILVGNMLEIFFFFHFLIWNSCAVLLICYYLFLHIQYFKYDPLTNVFNRSMLIAEMEELKHSVNVGIISFDLDNLKKVNDLKGHAEGDAYIVAASRMIAQCFSGLGRLFRIGGDEFIVIMTDTDEASIRSGIKQFHDSCRQNGISVSCGYAFNPSPENLSEMLSAADSAMYANKRERQINR